MLQWLKNSFYEGKGLGSLLEIELSQDRIRQLIRAQVRRVNHPAPNCPKLSSLLREVAMEGEYQKSVIKRIWAEEVNVYLENSSQ